MMLLKEKVPYTISQLVVIVVVMATLLLPSAEEKTSKQ